MNTVGKVLAAGGLLATGYLVGFYEMKYKTMKVLLKAAYREEKESQK